MNIKPTAWIALSFVILFSAGSHEVAAERSVEHIMARYYKAMGGLENLKSWKGMKVTGKIVLAAQGKADIPFTAWYKAPDKQRIEMTIDGQKAVYASDGRNPWFCDPTLGFVEPTPLPKEQAMDAVNHADEYPFIDYEKKGHKLEYLGTEMFEGREVFRVKLARNNGSESFHFFDKETGLETRILIPVKRGDTEGFQESIERDYRAVGWLTIPFHVDILFNGKLIRQMTIDSAELDPVCEDSFFEKPEQIKLPSPGNG